MKNLLKIYWDTDYSLIIIKKCLIIKNKIKLLFNRNFTSNIDKPIRNFLTNCK